MHQQSRSSEAPAVVGNIPKRDSAGISRHAAAPNVRRAYMVADVRWWKAKRIREAQLEPTQLPRHAKHRKQAAIRLHG